MAGITLDSDLRCPHCGFVQRLRMPTDFCLFFHGCSECKRVMWAKPGDCCVFCSYGSVPCPPRQHQAVRCTSGCTPE
ncbi:GDCCVxC domain-containing (seleno)protein [Pseudomonas sp. LFM046]|uniref:GDCCVxC domain-containing (seleno)protein n=1 Tax=Pseudomonas sp. LFM046 TaxID=1608357 RepID=UPI0005CFDEDB|nr:GDCCVxC domain-containing (seleno)protein [Pseudomonas sp. LFM046]